MRILIFAALLVSPLVQMAAPVPAAAQPSTAGYLLGINDEIHISVFGSRPLDVKTRIKEDGTITLPMLGEVEAKGMTTGALASTIANRLKSGRFFVDPVVNVEVVNFVSNAVTVFGNLQQPGVYPLDRSQSIAMILARAGGARADAADYLILRRAGQPDKRISLADLAADSGTGAPLAPGDTIFVPAAPVVFIYGQVNKPGKIVMRSGMTLRQALAEAGGPTLAGSQRKITLNRGTTKMKKVDLDIEVQPGDVFYINEKLF